jgi:putative CocE/NonD family hydrolase
MLGRMRKLVCAVAIVSGLLSCGGEAQRVHAPLPAATPANVADKPCVNPNALASAAVPTESPRLYDVKSIMIPMRDGVRLDTVIFTPLNAQAPLPILIGRTPYGITNEPKFDAAPAYASLIADGYIWVWQSLRGRFGSEGKFVMFRPLRDRQDPKAIDEATDAYDTIEWLVANVPNNNGRVGMMGTSYLGLTSAIAEAEPHPALKAIVEEASPADQFLGDDFHHNGAFRLAYGFEFVALLETSKTNTNFPYDRGDIFDFFLALGPLSNVDKRYFHGKMPMWNDFVAHPNYDAYWQKMSLDTQLTKATVPILNVAGWWDQEDFYGPLRIHALLEKNDTEKKNYFVAGPWNHGGWYGLGENLGVIEFGSKTGKHYSENIKAPFLAYHLHGKGKGDFPEAMVFETGTNRWRSFDSWPPTSGVQTKKLYLHAGRSLSFDPPKEIGKGAVDTYVSDPKNPVPYQPRPIAALFTSDQWPIWQVQDQLFAADRSDVLTYATSVLEEDVAVAGNIDVELYAGTSGTDSDWIVKLIDVFPEGVLPPRPPGHEFGPPPKDTPPDMRGYQLMIDGDAFRGRFRESFEKPVPMKPNAIAKYTISLHSHAHVFQKGHKIMLQVQSTWFPVIDRNPQRYVKNIFEATEADFITATQLVSRAHETPSAIVLPVMGK